MIDYSTKKDNYHDTNLLEETLEVLKRHNKTFQDVMWIGTQNEYITPGQFKEYAHNIWYDSGFGGAEIKEQLFVVGNDWWLERHEYDGSEWWEFKSMPIKPLKLGKFPDIFDNNI